MRKHYFLTALLLLIISVSIFALNKSTLKETALKSIKTPFNTETVTDSEFLPPSASISGTTTVCLNDTPPEITFTGSSGNAPYTFNYTLNGTAQTITSTGNTATVSANTNVIGTFVFHLISVTDDSNDSATINRNATVEVTEPPTVDFSFNNDGTCSGSSINFTSNPSGNSPFTYSWDFGDDNTSTSANPSHNFEALGCGTESFDVELTVTDANGCTSSRIHTVNVVQKPDIDFKDANFSNPAQYFNNCSSTSSDETFNITVENTSTSSCANNFIIDWGDGNSESFNTPTISHTYTYADTFRMEITATGDNGCIASKVFSVKNASNPQGNIVSPGSTQNLCAPAEIAFTISSNWGANSIDTVYDVDYGDGTIVRFLQSDMISSSFFNASDPQNSTPYPIPHTYSTSNCPSDFEATILIQNSCATTPGNSGGIRILKNADARFEVDETACVATQIIFNNTSDTASAFDCSDFVEFTWDFGDGTSEITTFDYSSVSHEYSTPGNYTIIITADNGICPETNFQDEICIEPELNPAFTLNTNNGCIPLAVQTTNTTDLSESCGGETYLWEVTYSSDFCGTTESWSFTNGTDENSAAPSINFATAGTYTLTLTTENSCGTNSTSETIEVKRPPTATINSISDACDSASISPIAIVDNCAPSTDTITYNWSFPGGTPSSANTLDPGTISYTTSGNHQITFSVTNGCGTTTDTEDFSVNPIPNITNTALTQTICSGTDITEVTLTADIASTTFTWTATAPTGVTGFIPSGNSDTIPVQTIFNSNTTSEDVTYVITPSIGGCDGTPVNLVITVDPAPAFTNQPDSESACLNGTITALSVSVNGPGTPTYQWYSNTSNTNIGGSELTGETASTYTPPNSRVGITYYYCVVSFSSGAGCNEIISDVATIEIVEGIQIDTHPTATHSLCVGGDIASALTISHSGGTGTISYQWYSNTTNSNSGGTSISGATNSSYTPTTFNTAGSYYYYVMISLNGSGCSDISSEVAEVVVVDDPITTNQPQASQTICQGITPQDLEVTASGGLGTTYTYQWYSNSTNNNSGGNIITGATNASYTPPTATVGSLYYYVEVSQPGIDCSVVSNTAEVTVNPAPNFTSQPTSNTYCLGDTLSQLSVNYENGVGTPTFQWYRNSVNDTSTGSEITGETNQTFNPPSTSVGTVYYYAVITFSSGGCTQITSNIAEITINQTPNISNKTDIICSVNAFTIAPDNTGGDTTPTGTTYTWATPTINPAGTITGASNETAPQTNISQTLTNTTTNPATVTYSVTPTSGSCIGNTFEVEITVNPSISITTSQTNSNCYSANEGALDITITGGVPFLTGDPYQISWIGPNGFTSSNEDISNLEPGDYTVSILDDGGCPFTENFTTTEPEELIFSTIDFDPETISCFNADDGSIGIEVSGGTTPYTYNWTRNGVPFATTQDLTNLSPGDYEVTITDASNCPTIDTSFSIVEPVELNVSLINQVDIICFREATGEININTVGGRTIEVAPGIFGYNYSWIGPNGFTSNQQNLSGLIAGTYNVTVTDRSNCTDTLEVILNESDEIIIDYSATEIECYDDNDATITINNISGGNSPYTVTWSNLGSGMSQSNLSPGDYTITVTDNTNCEKAVTITIAEPPIFTINPVTNNVSCFGENDGRIILNLVGGIDPVNLVWDDDATAGVERNNIGPGTYTVTITDGKPCVISETFTITEPDALSLSANTTDALNCDDANSGAINLIVTGGTAPFTYSWSNGTTTEDLNNIPPGNYSVNITDANNCTISGDWQIDRFEPLEINVDTETIYDCDTKSIDQTFIALVSGGVPPYNINWSSGTISGSNGEFMSTTQNGLVIIDVSDSANCNTSFSYNVAIPSFGDADFSLTSSAISSYGFFSIEDPIDFTNLATGDYQSVSWDFGDGNFSSDENPTHTYINEGSYSVVQTVTYPFGCIYTKQFSLVIEKGYRLIMPNAFTPNGDSMNAYFSPESIALNAITFNIYDTWGSLVYSEEGDTIKGWDGKINDAEAENGNYYFTFSAKTFYGRTITKKGAFTSIK
ncbi:PKD domain-containing protein [Algibacter sp. AS12]|uniref:PKD domain-containing protein n=1 Tax=Algibacter sp. AS12 TaxID=3135773 RepID=UPI00398BB05B